MDDSVQIEEIAQDAFFEQSDHLEHSYWLRRGTRFSGSLRDSLLLVYMVGLLVWGFLELTLMVYTVLGSSAYGPNHRYLLIGVNLLGLAVGLVVLLHHRCLSAYQEALQSEIWEQREAFSRRIRHASITDRLTGLHTLVYFWQRLEEEIDRAWRYHHTFALLILDFRGFHAVNERYGRLRGDIVLRNFSQLVLGPTVRTTDVLARYGGDQFVVLLPETEAEGAQRLAGRITERAGEILILPPGEPLSMVVSVVSYPNDGITREGLLRKAEEKLTFAKLEGRSQRPDWEVNDLQRRVDTA